MKSSISFSNEYKFDNRRIQNQQEKLGNKSCFGRLFTISCPSNHLTRICKVAILIIVSMAFVHRSEGYGIRHQESSQAQTVLQSPYCFHTQKWMSQPAALLLERPIPAVWTTNEELVKRYEKLDFLGAGGAGAVFKVFDKYLGKDLALKISSEYYGTQYASKCISHLLDSGITPHIVRPYDVYSSKRIPHIKQADSHFFVDIQVGSRSCSTQILTLELMEGDLESFCFSERDFLIFEIQMRHVQGVLQAYGVTTSDAEKERNILYKKVDRSDCFQGYSMIDFDFWKYSIDGFDFYVPRPKYLLKLGDFDCWQFPSPFPLERRPKQNDKDRATFDKFVQVFNLFDEFLHVEEYLAEWTKVPSQGTILDMDSMVKV